MLSSYFLSVSLVHHSGLTLTLSLLKKDSIHAEDQKLIALAKKNRKYFKALYEKYFDQIFWFTMKRTGREALSGDLTQQVFYKAMLNLNKYQFQGHPFSSWLYRIALNEINQFYRKTKKSRYVEIEEDMLQDMAQEIELHDTPQQEPAELLASILQVLNPEELSIIEMKYFEGKTYREIGEILSLKESAAKVRAHRIIKKLKTTITQVKP